MGGRLFIFVLLCGLASPLFGRALHAPRTYNLTSQWNRMSLSVALSGSAELKLDPSAALPGSELHFVDLLPDANWSHPALIRVVGRDGRILQEIKTNRPPRNLSRLPLVDDVFHHRSEEVQFKISDLGGALKVKDPSRFYAYLLNGNADRRHWNDFSYLYRVLTTVYGYSKNQIFVADSVHKQSKGDLDGDGSADILHESTRAGLDGVLALLKERVNPDDQLLIVVNDHGSLDNGEATIVLHDKEIKAREMGLLLRALPVKRVLHIFEQCYSGGFVRPSLDDSRVAMAASTNNEFSWATEDLRFDEFLYHAIAAFAKQTHEGIAVTSDGNGDGKISAQEAFAYAHGRDQSPESPLLEASANSGLSSLIGIGF